MYTQVTISVSGYSKLEAEKSFPDLLEEFQHRPWFLKTKVEWNSENNQVWVILTVAGDDMDFEAEATSDEVWDCVIATFPSTKNTISFRVHHTEII